MTTIENAHSEYVGLNPSASHEEQYQQQQQRPLTPAPLPKSRIATYIQIAVALLSIRILYAFHKPLAFLGFLMFGIIAAYQLNTQSQQAIQHHNARFTASNNSVDGNTTMNMDRINREREESEAMVADAARMMKEINQRHLQEFIITHPDSSYEEWIGKLHPENVDDNNVLDHRFYVHDSDHRILWNEMIGEERESVPARSSSQKETV